MNNFAALVDAMSADKSVQRAVLGVFNSNMLFAYLVEKLLTHYYEPEDQNIEKR